MTISTKQPTEEVEPEPDDPGKPLSAVAVQGILLAHRSQRPSGPDAEFANKNRSHVLLAFRPSDGVFFGSPNVEHRIGAEIHRFVVLDSHEVPTDEQLARVRVHADGSVSWLPEVQP
jgi:hypothetical protein